MKISVPCVLFYSDNARRRQQIQQLCVVQQLKFIPLNEVNAHTPLGLLAGAQDWRRPGIYLKQNALEEFCQDLLVLAGLPEPKLDRMLSLMKSMGCRVEMKAVLTNTNAMWNALMLQAHLLDEMAQRP